MEGASEARVLLKEAQEQRFGVGMADAHDAEGDAILAFPGSRRLQSIPIGLHKGGIRPKSQAAHGHRRRQPIRHQTFLGLGAEEARSLVGQPGEEPLMVGVVSHPVVQQI